MANWYDLKSQPAAASGLNLSRNEQHQFLNQKIPMRQQQQQLHIHRALSMQMASPRPINAFDALTRASAERRNYLLTANINPHQKPGQPATLTNSSRFFNKTLSLLQSHAQSSRLHNLATTAANTSRALESARKKMIRMEERCVLPSIATGSDSSKEEEAAHLSEPTDNDVLLGRGGRSNNHRGNGRYRELIRHNRGRYRELPKHEKIKLSRSIVTIVHKLGGRFLEPNPNYNELYNPGEGAWRVVGTKKAVEKTSQCLREKRRGDKGGAKVSMFQAITDMRSQAKVSDNNKQQVRTTSKAA